MGVTKGSPVSKLQFKIVDPDDLPDPDRRSFTPFLVAAREHPNKYIELPYLDDSRYSISTGLRQRYRENFEVLTRPGKRIFIRALGNNHGPTHTRG